MVPLDCFGTGARFHHVALAAFPDLIGKQLLHPHGDDVLVMAAVENDELAAVRDLRAAGERVVSALPGAPADPGELGCDRVLVEREGRWVVEALSTPFVREPG